MTRLYFVLIALGINFWAYSQKEWTHVTPSGDGIALVNIDFYYAFNEENLFFIKAVSKGTIEWNCDAEVLLFDETGNEITNSLGQIFVNSHEEIIQKEYDLSKIEGPEDRNFLASGEFHIREPREETPVQLSIELFNIRALNRNGDFLVIEGDKLIKM